MMQDAGPIRCPECETEMVEMEAGDITIDRCPVCASVWFDLGEIDRFIEHRMQTGKAPPDEADFKISTSGEPTRCPCCGEDHFRLGAVRGVAFQRCGWCGGIYLTRPQLEELRRSTAGQVSTSGLTTRDGLEGFLDLIWSVANSYFWW